MKSKTRNKIIIGFFVTIFLGVVSSAIYDLIKKPSNSSINSPSMEIKGNNNDNNSINISK